jgi:hypothetical protein
VSSGAAAAAAAASSAPPNQNQQHIIHEPGDLSMSKGAVLLEKLSGVTGKDQLGKVIEATPRHGKAGLGSGSNTVPGESWQEGVRRGYRERWQRLAP